MSKIWRVEEEQVMKAGKIIGTNYTVWYKDENGARTARRDYRHGHYKVIPMTVLNFILDESNEAVTRYQEFDGRLYKRTMYKPAEHEQTEGQTAEATETAQDATQATTDAAPLQLETLAAKLDRMDAAETARIWARNSLAWYDGESETIDAATDDAIWHALRNYREQFHAWNAAPTPINDAHQTGRTPEIIAAIEAEDVQNLFKAYGVTA